MKILGIDSSGMVASAAVLVDDTLVSEFTVNNKQTHSQTLLPMIDQVVQMSGVALEELDAIAVAAGPGSFTGLRIGASTAKGLGLALDKPIVPVPTLEGLAYRLAGTSGLICPLMDARRNQVYTGIYRCEPGQLQVVSAQKAVGIEDILRELVDYQEPVTFLGDGVPVQMDTIRQMYTGVYQLAPVHLSRQSAAAVAALGQIYYQQGKIETAEEHRPVYLRKSQAEREREARLHQQRQEQ
ncbi:MAG: tRNA (adenosine(37)-N6)-threonylcarbamoyltransferase complex dimerization subunit type 1 TsaB [Eubacteriales bacterium]|nr:tRNA (adenosine(37)-N6)-threonylcarbamoyltransferase complex dimerization subunit type 1 TsaB [Eubacteriales bacterium]